LQLAWVAGVVFPSCMLLAQWDGAQQLRLLQKWAWPLALMAAMLSFMWLGTLPGEKINARISQETFTRNLAVMLLLSGASLRIK
jgi:uncharacterized membrane protein YfcA